MFEYLKYLTAIKVIYDNQELIIGCSYIGCRITSAIINKVCDIASNCRCTFCQEDRSKGNKPKHY